MKDRTLDCTDVTVGGWPIDDARVSNLFGETMILLHQTNNAIWGVASPGEEITVTARWGAEANPVSINGEIGRCCWQRRSMARGFLWRFVAITKFGLPMLPSARSGCVLVRRIWVGR